MRPDGSLLRRSWSSNGSSFETEAKKYVESFVKQVEQQQETFKLQAAAQLNAWREAADKLGSAANEFAAERRNEIDATLKRMNADAAAAEGSSRIPVRREPSPGPY